MAHRSVDGGVSRRRDGREERGPHHDAGATGTRSQRTGTGTRTHATDEGHDAADAGIDARARTTRQRGDIATHVTALAIQ
jgi:hypothetical protein